MKPSNKLIFLKFLKKIRPDLIEIADKIDPNVDIGVQSDSSSDSSSSSSSSSSETESDDELNKSDDSLGEEKKLTKRFVFLFLTSLRTYLCLIECLIKAKN
jgi:histone arginine demethylase JMJD6